jgi:isoaspartyl peptidase/L-asparaginase-like protein (Ntn-hydrolase superfamily)
MAVGRAFVKSEIDARMASIVEQVWNALDQAHDAAAWLADTNITGASDANLTAIGYVAADLTLMRGAINDLGAATGLWGVAHNQKTVTATNDFFFNGKKITGPNYTG